LNGTNALPAGALASGAEGIKEAIQGFDDACVFSFLTPFLLSLLSFVPKTLILFFPSFDHFWKICR
jgi:hypothetical protein